jgi:PAS domain S-box-containing protein
MAQEASEDNNPGERPGSSDKPDLQAVLDAATAVLYAKDAGGYYLFVSRQFETLFGVPEDQVKGKTDYDIFPKNVADTIRANDSTVLQTGRPVELEEVVRLADGPHTYISVKFPIRNAAGVLYAVGSISTDITVRKRAEIEERGRAEARLKQSEEHYRSLIENALDLITILDADGTVRYVSPSVERVLGYTREERVGMSTFDLIHPDDRAGVQEVIAREGPTPASSARLEFRVRHKDGSWRFLEGVGRNLLHNPAVAGIVVNSRDITQRKQAEEALRHHEAELQQSQEELRRLTAGLFAAQEEERRRVSRELHDDLSQKLAMLVVEVETMERALPESADLICNALRSLRERADGITDDVRRIAHQLHPSILEHLGLVAALRRYCSDFSRQAGIRVRFTHRNVPEDVPQEIALCLYRVTQESLRNAAKHSGHTRASVSLTGTEDRLHLSISDRGVGFDPNLVKGKGGLGIVSMEERVRLAAGIVSIKSRPGDGARIDVQVPLTGRVQ